MQGRIGAQVCSSHFKLKKHKDGIERLVRKGKQDKDIEEAFTAYNKEEHLVGTAATNDTQVYRVKVVTAFLKAGIPLNKWEYYERYWKRTVCDLQGGEQ